MLMIVYFSIVSSLEMFIPQRNSRIKKQQQQNNNKKNAVTMESWAQIFVVLTLIIHRYPEQKSNPVRFVWMKKMNDDDFFFPSPFHSRHSSVLSKIAEMRARRSCNVLF